MLKETMEKALNEQINAELYSSYLYYSMSAYFESQNLKGFANWMRVQAMEEMFHADKFFKFLNNRGGRVLLQAIAAPKTQWGSIEEVIQETLQHERHVTARIHNLAELSMTEKDFATKTFLDWFVNEQVEEEASVDEILHNVKMASHSQQTLFMLDRELATRTFVMPAEGSAT